MSNTVLITGGAGFIGSFLCKRYLKEGWKVICLDNFFTGSKKNVDPFINNPNFSLIEHDIVYPFILNDNIDLLLNFACPASPVHYQYNPIKTIKTNVLGTINMLGIAKKHGCRFFQASTSEIYGDPTVHPQPEEYFGNVNTIGPRSCYDEGKRVAETLCFNYHREHNVDIRVIRIFNTYGPNMAINDGRVVSNFIIQALKGEDLTVFGDGSQTRSFCYVDDLIEGIYRFSTQDKYIGPINLGNTGEFTIKELAEEVLKQINTKSTINYKPIPIDDPKQRKPDISKAKKYINWTPKIPLNIGIKSTIPYFRKILNL